MHNISVELGERKEGDNSLSFNIIAKVKTSYGEQDLIFDSKIALSDLTTSLEEDNYDWTYYALLRAGTGLCTPFIRTVWSRISDARWKLNIHQGKIEDPSMARLLDGVALLNAKVEKKLSEQLPEVIEGILSVLYPSYIQTVPSVAYLELTTEEGLVESNILPKGLCFRAQTQKMSAYLEPLMNLKLPRLT